MGNGAVQRKSSGQWRIEFNNPIATLKTKLHSILEDLIDELAQEDTLRLDFQALTV